MYTQTLEGIRAMAEAESSKEKHRLEREACGGQMQPRGLSNAATVAPQSEIERETEHMRSALAKVDAGLSGLHHRLISGGVMCESAEVAGNACAAVEQCRTGIGQTMQHTTGHLLTLVERIESMHRNLGV